VHRNDWNSSLFHPRPIPSLLRHLHQILKMNAHLRFLSEAYEFARKAHNGQLYGNKPYVTGPRRAS
jgi:(p)ppGpp synthase/HD superfamily hydrolase